MQSEFSIGFYEKRCHQNQFHTCSLNAAATLYNLRENTLHIYTSMICVCKAQITHHIFEILSSTRDAISGDTL